MFTFFKKLFSTKSPSEEISKKEVRDVCYSDSSFVSLGEIIEKMPSFIEHIRWGLEHYCSPRTISLGILDGFSYHMQTAEYWREFEPSRYDCRALQGKARAMIVTAERDGRVWVVKESLSYHWEIAPGRHRYELQRTNEGIKLVHIIYYMDDGVVYKEWVAHEELLPFLAEKI